MDFVTIIYQRKFKDTFMVGMLESPEGNIYNFRQAVLDKSMILQELNPTMFYLVGVTDEEVEIIDRYNSVFTANYASIHEAEEHVDLVFISNQILEHYRKSKARPN